LEPKDHPVKFAFVHPSTLSNPRSVSHSIPGRPTKSRDDHAAHQTVVLAMYCAHAAIYRKSPEGLKVSSPDGFYWGPKAERGKVPVNDAQHAILQKLAWETVSKYPYAGIAK